MRTEAERDDPPLRPVKSAPLFNTDEKPGARLAAPRRRAMGATFAVAWVAVVAIAFLIPALRHGFDLGPYDILSHLGLTAKSGAQTVHNLVDSDEVEEFIPWQMLAWLQVHAGHLPLWNPDSLLGLPLAFNFQSAPFSAAVIAGYLVPLHFAHTVTIFARLLIAGGGVLALCRALRMKLLSGLVAATIYELSGGVTIWLGSYEAGCLGWMGWMVAASVLVLRGRHRARDVALLACAFAALLYAGEPQIALLALGALCIFVFCMAISLAKIDRVRASRAALDHLLGVLAGSALAAPVYLPGIQLALNSVRASGPPVVGLPLYDLTHLIFGSYDGSPTNLPNVIGPDNLYVSTVYVGVIALVLAVVALSLVRPRKEVVAFFAIAVVFLVLIFASPVVDLLQHVAYLKSFRILLGTTLIDFALAMLAGFGCEALLLPRRVGRQPAQDRLLALGLTLVTVTLAVLGVRLALNVDHLSPAQRHAREIDFVWPVVEVVALAAVLVVRRRAGARRGESVGALGLSALLVIEALFLIFSGSGIVSADSTGMPTNAATAELEQIVGSSVLGIGSCATNSLPTIGLASDANLAYSVDEFAVLDPILPSAYDGAYQRATGSANAPSSSPSLFCPAVDSVALARQFGVSYIIEPPGVPGPKGTVAVTDVAGEELYKVPDSGRVTITPLGGPSPRTTVVSTVSMVSPTVWKLTVDPRSRSLLRVRLTDVPGWEATINGRALSLRPFEGVMLQAVVPPGHSTIQLVYRPKAFSIGLYLALAAAVLLVAGMVIGFARHRQRAGRPPRLSLRRDEQTSLPETRPLVGV